MKTIFGFLAAALLAAGCTKSIDEQATPAPQAPVSLYVSAAHAEAADPDLKQSRAILDNKLSKWEPGDEIALYARSYDNNPLADLAKLIASLLTNDERTAIFDGFGTQPADIDTYFAAYPSNSDINSSRALFSIPAAQAATDTPQLMMAATAKDQPRGTIPLNFAPVNAFLCVRLAEGLGITSVRFEGCDGETVTGDYEYRFADGITSLTGAGKQITVTNPSTEFYITLPAVTLRKGYSLTFFRGEDQMIKSYGYGQPKIFEAGNVYIVPTISEFTPTAMTLGTVRSTYETPEAPATEPGMIYLTGNSFQGIPTALIAEIGIEYNVKGNADKSRITYSLDALAPGSRSFDVAFNASPELYEVRMYLTDVYGTTHTTPIREVGVLGASTAVVFSTASSYDTDGVVTKNNSFDLGGNGFRASATLTDIAPSLVTSAVFNFAGGKTGSAQGKIAATCTADITGLAPSEWTSYTVDGTVTLSNGHTFSGTTHTTVTGIPYLYKFNTAANYWTLRNTEWASAGALELQVNKTDDSRGYAVSPAFNLPQEMPVDYTVMGYYYSSMAGSGNCTIWVEPTIDTSTKSQTSAGHYKSVPNILLAGNYSGDSNTGNFTLSASKPYFVISHNCSSGTLQQRYIVIWSAALLYR